MKNVARIVSRVLLRKARSRTRGRVTGLPLESDVEVARDRWGIPHITAGNMHDLFFAQGWVHAQDRLWQMETLRRLCTGRVSEIAGPGAVKLDWFCRMSGMPEMRERTVAGMSDGGAFALPGIRGRRERVHRRNGRSPAAGVRVA